MVKTEFIAPHTFAFAGAYFVTVVVTTWMGHGSANYSDVYEVLMLAAFGIFWSLMEAACYSLGCAWGGVSRPRRVSWALVGGVVVALGFLVKAAIDSAVPPPTNLDEAKEEYTRGIIRVAYTFLAPVLAGLISAWISKRVRQ